MEALRETDEVTLLELLGLNSTDIVDAFRDEIFDDYDRLTGLLNDEY